MITAFPSNYADQIDEIRELYGRDITINVVVSGIPCTNPDDSLDPVTGLSTNQFCDVCGGKYWTNTVSGYVTKARILYKGVGTPVWNPHGFIFDGDAQIRIKYTVENFGHVQNSDTFTVDDKDYILKSYDLRGIPDPNRIVIALIEKE